MFIRDPPKSVRRKELKVNLPARQHRDLRALQSTLGQDAPRIIAEALDLYFRQIALDAGVSRATGPAGSLARAAAIS